MPQSPASRDFNTFVKGIITEASPLTFPENASIDEQNFVLERSGTRKRRLGMDFEPEYSLRDLRVTSTELSKLGVSIHTWKSINENPSLSFYVIQIGTNLHFYDATSGAISASPRNKGNPVTLNGDEEIQWQSSNLGGRFIMVTGSNRVYSLEYDEVTDTVTFVTHGLLVRDLWGIDDGLDVDERPGSLSENHKYNLFNQGWGGDDIDSTLSYYQSFKNTVGKYPSNADLVQAGKSPSDHNVFLPHLVARAFAGNTPAPKGHYILDLFDRGKTRGYSPSNTSLLNNYGNWSGLWRNPYLNYGAFADLSTIPGIILNTPVTVPEDKTVSGITVTAPYAERIFYSGMSSELVGGDSKSPLLGHLVFYTQLVDSANKLGLCYQEADPTSEDQSDLVATDGGFIKIPEMTRCLKLIPFSKSLVVIAENGVWEITGSDEGFSATTFQVVKVTDIGASGAGSIIQVEDRIYYWSRGGIYTITRDQVSLALMISNISEMSIQSLFETFGLQAISNAQGSYDTFSKQIRWLLNTEDDYDGVSERFRFNTELIYDVVLEAFYLSKLPQTNSEYPYVAASIASADFINISEDLEVVVGLDNVVIGPLQVAVPKKIRLAEPSKIIYLTFIPKTPPADYKYTFSYYRNGYFEDWADNGTPVDAPAYLLTGYITAFTSEGGYQKQQQVTYMTTHLIRTESGFVDDGFGGLAPLQPSSCLVQSRWDFANSPASGKFSDPFQVYRLKRNYIPFGFGDPFDYGYEVITTKSKLRGRGRTLSLLFSTEPRKDLILLGWGLIFGVNTNV